MGRQRTAAQIARQAALALARENYYKNKPASTLTTVRKRAIRKFVYNSYSLTSGAGASQLLSVPVSDSALNYMTAGTDALIAATKLGDLDYARFYLTPEKFTNSKN